MNLLEKKNFMLLLLAAVAIAIFTAFYIQSQGLPNVPAPSKEVGQMEKKKTTEEEMVEENSSETGSEVNQVTD
ncbi:MAG: hypothetical protein ACC618_01985 [Patescibacteria group bacterium]